MNRIVLPTSCFAREVFRQIADAIDVLITAAVGSLRDGRSTAPRQIDRRTVWPATSLERTTGFEPATPTLAR